MRSAVTAHYFAHAPTIPNPAPTTKPSARIGTKLLCKQNSALVTTEYFSKEVPSNWTREWASARPVEMAEDHPNENKRAYLFRACCSQEVRGFWPRAGERGRGKAWSEGKLGVQERGWKAAGGLQPQVWGLRKPEKGLPEVGSLGNIWLSQADTELKEPKCWQSLPKCGPLGWRQSWGLSLVSELGSLWSEFFLSNMVWPLSPHTHLSPTCSAQLKGPFRNHFI